MGSARRWVVVLVLLVATGVAGLVPGDEVLAVDGTPATALGFGGAIAAIRGEAETVVRLSIRTGGKAPAREVVVQRRRIGT